MACRPASTQDSASRIKVEQSRRLTGVLAAAPISKPEYDHDTDCVVEKDADLHRRKAAQGKYKNLTDAATNRRLVALKAGVCLRKGKVWQLKSDPVTGESNRLPAAGERNAFWMGLENLRSVPIRCQEHIPHGVHFN